ncbi:MAG: hypothetical protein Fur0037_24450 [Planctomycetota bacterium]
MTEPTTPGDLVSRADRLGVRIPREAAQCLLAYLDAMLQLNERINLTGVRDREAAVCLHLLDSLAVGLLGLDPSRVLDLGSGNGFPGLGAAALYPRAVVVLLDRTGKKVRAIDSCLKTTGWPRVETLQGDAAQLPALRRDLRGAFDLVTARAVGEPAAVAPLAAPLIRPGGRLALWLDARSEPPSRCGGLCREKTLRYSLPPPAERSRILAAFRR